MKNPPCVRLASRIRPKMSENPDDSRNSRPPSERLLRPWMIQNCIVGRSRSETRGGALPYRKQLGFEISCRRIIARINWILQECGLVVGPELGDIRICLDHGIYQPAVAARHLSDINVADGVAEIVKLDEAPHGVGVAAADGRHQGLLVLDVAIDGLQRGFQHLARDVSTA